MKNPKTLNIARPSTKIAGFLLMGIALLSQPGTAFCQSKTSATARLYIRVNVIPILHSEPPTQPRSSTASIAFDLTTQPTQFDRQAATRAVNDQSIAHDEPIVLTTVTLTAK
jgi:hypothetical protein